MTPPADPASTPPENQETLLGGLKRAPDRPNGPEIKQYLDPKKSDGDRAADEMKEDAGRTDRFDHLALQSEKRRPNPEEEEMSRFERLALQEEIRKKIPPLSELKRIAEGKPPKSLLDFSDIEGKSVRVLLDAHKKKIEEDAMSPAQRELAKALPSVPVDEKDEVYDELETRMRGLRPALDPEVQELDERLRHLQQGMAVGPSDALDLAGTRGGTGSESSGLEEADAETSPRSRRLSVDLPPVPAFEPGAVQGGVAKSGRGGRPGARGDRAESSDGST